MKIYFKDLNTDIQHRAEQIKRLHKEQNGYLEITEKFKVIISPEHKGRALEIATKLRELREQNEVESVLLTKGKEVCKKYNLDLDNLNKFKLSIPYLEKKADELEKSIEINRKINKATFDEQKTSKYSPFYKQIQLLNQTRQELDNHIRAQKEITLITGEGL